MARGGGGASWLRRVGLLSQNRFSEQGQGADVPNVGHLDAKRAFGKRALQVLCGGFVRAGFTP